VDLLEAIYLRLKKTVAQRVTVVEFGVDSGCGDGTGCFRIKVIRTGATELIDTRIA